VHLQTISQRPVRRIIAVPFMLLLFALAAGAQQAAIGFCALNKNCSATGDFTLFGMKIFSNN